MTHKYAGQMRSGEVNSIGGAAAPGVATRIPGFNDYVEPYPWIGTISITNNFTLNNTTFIEATYGWVQNQLGSMIVTPRSNRFNAGLGNLPLLYTDAGLIDPRYTRTNRWRRRERPIRQRPDPVAADVCVRQPRGQRSAEPRLPWVHEHQPHQDFSIV